MQQLVQHDRGLAEEENARRWEIFQLTKNCPVCRNDLLQARKYRESPKKPEHWRWTCRNNDCKSQWYKPFE